MSEMKCKEIGTTEAMFKKPIKISERSGELWSRMFCQTSFRFTPHGEEHIINLEGFGQILDEVRKDFPDISKLNNFESYSFAVENWVLKWLGDAK